MVMSFLRTAGVAAAAWLLTTSVVTAQDVKLPSTLTFTAYDTGSSGFNIAVAVGKMLKDKHGTDVRVLPAGNDVARLAPLKAGRAQVSAMGIGIYFAQEGVFEFGVKEWGPQPLRLILAVTDCNAISLGVAKDTGVKEVKDLKGKRIGMVVGSPALNQNAFAILAFGGLTQSDVKLVEFSSYGAMWKGMVNNEVDAAIASNISGQAKEVESFAARHLFPPTPPHGQGRLGAGATRSAPTTCRTRRPAARRLPAGAPRRAAGLSVSDLHGLCDQPAELVYSLAKAMIEDYDAYKDAAPGAAGLDAQAPESDLGAAVPRRRGAGVEGGRRLEAGARGPQPEAALKRQKVAGRRLGVRSQGRPARRQGRVPQGLDGGAQGRARGGGHGPDLRIAARARAAGRGCSARARMPTQRAAPATRSSRSLGAPPAAQTGRPP